MTPATANAATPSTSPVGRAPEPATEAPAAAPVLVAPAAPVAVVGTPMPTSDLQAVETEAMRAWSMERLHSSAHLGGG